MTDQIAKLMELCAKAKSFEDAKDYMTASKWWALAARKAMAISGECVGEMEFCVTYLAQPKTTEA